MAYEELAGLYDGLMEEIDYAQWVDYLTGLLQTFSCPGKQLVDLGCGTGNITIPLAQRGYSVLGIDRSDEMLAQAVRKSAILESGCQCALQWQQQDMTMLDLTTLPLTEAPAAVLATFDAFNYILEPESLQQLFLQLADGLPEKGLLIFDVQTPYKLREVLGDQCYVYHDEVVDYMWENHFDSTEEICTMVLTLFARQEDGLYRRMEEIHEEKVYDLDLLQLWLDLAGFEILGVYGALTQEPVQSQDHRAVFVARKRAWEDGVDFEDAADLLDDIFLINKMI